MYATYDLSVAETFGVSAAVFLSRLQYWLGKTSNHKNGKKWVYNTYEQWSAQLGMSKRTIQRVVKLLRDKGVIEVGVFNGVKWNRTQWYTLTDKWLKKGQSVHIHKDKTATSMTKISDKEKQESMNKQSKTAEEVLKEFQQKGPIKPDLPDSPTVLQAERYWRQMYRVKYDLMLPPLTMKRVGQLKLILKRSEGKGGVILRQVFNNWQSCRAAIPHMTPDRPDIGNILVNLDVVLNWALKKEEGVQLVAKPVEVKQYEVKQVAVKEKPIWLED